MSDLSVFLLVLVLFVALLTVAGVVFTLRSARRSNALRRLGVAAALVEDRTPATDTDEPFGRGVRRWLGLAGYRGAHVPALFVGMCVITVVAGLIVMLIVGAAGLFDPLVAGLYSIPGDFAQVLVPLIHAAPLIVFVLIALAPILVVRAARRARVEAAERELPVLLELLATLAEAGLGFDAAIAEILKSDQGRGVLADEFRNFQRETLSGVPRQRCLRRMAQRVDVPTFSTFVSSLVQAERSGFGLSDVLRVQADDMRNRRKERALMKAQALPVKLVFPLVVCFLPALFVLTLGPAFHQFFQITDSVAGNIK